MTAQLATHPKRFAALNALPPSYTLVQHLAIETRARLILLNVLGLIPLISGFIVLVGIDLAVHRLPGADWLAGASPITLSIVVVLSVVIMLSVHELCHGLAFQVFGAHPRYGVNLRKAVAYASASSYYLTRDAYLVVGLAPLVIISSAAIVAMLLTGGWLKFVIILLGAANAGGAIGDLWFAIVCLRHPSTLLVRDYGDGAELYEPTPLQ